MDWKIIQDIANRVGLPMNDSSAEQIFDELVSLMPNYTNLSYDNLGPTGKLYPNATPRRQTARSSCSRTRSTPRTGWLTWCRRVDAGAASCRTTSTRSCSTPGACSSTGTRAR